MRRRRDEVSCASSPFSLVKDASRSAQPTKFEALAVTIRWSSLYIADCVIDQRPVKCLLWVTSSGLIMSRLGQVSLTKPTYRRIVLRCCSVPQAKPSPDYEYRISLRPHPVGHPSSSTRDSASRAVPSSIRVRRDGYREAGEWQQAEGDQRGRAAQKVFARAGSRKPRSDQHQECSTTDNRGYRRLDSAGPTGRSDRPSHHRLREVMAVLS